MKSLSLYFSPTGGGEKIAKAIQNGIDQNDYDYQFSLNLNKRPVSAETGEIETLPVIFTIPVYGGHMPKVAMERLNTLRSECNQPAIQSMATVLLKRHLSIWKHSFVNADSIRLQQEPSLASTPTALTKHRSQPVALTTRI